MSPSEHELRAALSDGEGPGLDVDAIIGSAVAYRRQRRARVLSGVSVVAIVAGIGVGAGFLVNSSDNAPSHSNAGRAALSPNAASAPGSGAGGANASDAANCPAQVPAIAAPSSTASGSLFPQHVQTVVVCAYGSQLRAASKSVTPASTTFSGDEATALVASINDATATTGGPCPEFQTTHQPQQYVMFGLSDTGTASSPVVATVGDNPCQTVITNGKAARYRWSPPSGLASILAELTPTGSSVTVPSIGPTGTPIPSQTHS